MTVLYVIAKILFYFAVFLTFASLAGWIKRKRAAGKAISAPAVKDDEL